MRQFKRRHLGGQTHAQRSGFHKRAISQADQSQPPHPERHTSDRHGRQGGDLCGAVDKIGDEAIHQVLVGSISGKGSSRRTIENGGSRVKAPVHWWKGGPRREDGSDLHVPLGPLKKTGRILFGRGVNKLSEKLRFLIQFPHRRRRGLRRRKSSWIFDLREKKRVRAARVSPCRSRGGGRSERSQALKKPLTASNS